MTHHFTPEQPVVAAGAIATHWYGLMALILEENLGETAEVRNGAAFGVRALDQASPSLYQLTAHRARRYCESTVNGFTDGTSTNSLDWSVRDGHVKWWVQVGLEVKLIVFNEPLNRKWQSDPRDRPEHMRDDPESICESAFRTKLLPHVAEPARSVWVLPSPLKTQGGYLIWEAMYNQCHVPWSFTTRAPCSSGLESLIVLLNPPVRVDSESNVSVPLVLGISAVE